MIHCAVLYFPTFIELDSIFMKKNIKVFTFSLRPGNNNLIEQQKEAENFKLVRAPPIRLSGRRQFAKSSTDRAAAHGAAAERRQAIGPRIGS